jgi:hypothetical protein
VGFVVDKVALRQAFSEYFGFPSQSFHLVLHTHHHPSSSSSSSISMIRGWYSRPVVASVIVDSAPVHPKGKELRTAK